MLGKKTNKKKVPVIVKLKKIKGLKVSWKKTLITTLLVLAVLTALYFSRSLFIVAFVNGKPISRWGLDRDLEKAAGSQILNTKIAEMLVLQEGRNQKISISDEEINQEAKKLDDQFKAQGQSLDAVLALQKQSKKEFLRQIKIQLLVEKILGKDIQVTDEEIADYFEENQELLAEGATLASEKENLRQTIFNNKLTEKIQPWLTELQTKAKIIYFLKL